MHTGFPINFLDQKIRNKKLKTGTLALQLDMNNATNLVLNSKNFTTEFEIDLPHFAIRAALVGQEEVNFLFTVSL